LARVREDITLMPGIQELLKSLDPRTGKDGDLMLGVLTGNFEAASRMKLTAAGFDLTKFPVMAFAEDGRTRDDLPRVAMERAGMLLGEPIPPERVYIIGDTPRDIACARACGCVAVAVATGRYAADQLDRADLVFDTLEDPTPLLERLDAGPPPTHPRRNAP
jgi:phosphoglycolate phosphatase-like HAD superfamily hydrolase